jgi:putative hemolysin
MDQGAGGLFIHLKVEVNPDIPIRDMDDIILHLKERLQSNLPNVREVLVEAMADESELAWNQKFSKLIEEGQRDEVLNPREVEILKNFFDFTQTDLADVMVPRPDVLSVELSTPIIEVADLFIESRYSKLPVYKERVDNVVGVVHERDVFECLRHQRLETPLAELLRDIDRYPETKAVSDLLEDFKRKRIQMAAVADEHGAFAGMVTLADIMEQLVGDLWDDDREEEEAPSLEQLSPTMLRLNGKYDIWDLNELYGLNIPDDDYKTIGGFVFGLLGREPEAGDEVIFEGMTFKVEEADEARIVSVRLSSPTELSLVEALEDHIVKQQESL